MATFYGLPNGWEGSGLGGIIIHKTVGEVTARAIAFGPEHGMKAELVELHGYSPYCDPAYSKVPIQVHCKKRFTKGSLLENVLTAMSWTQVQLGGEALTKEEEAVVIASLEWRTVRP